MIPKSITLFAVFLIAHVREQGNLTGALDSRVQFALVLCTSAGNAAGKDLCTLGNELSQLCNILVINGVDLVYTENANLFLSVHRTEGTRIIVVSFHLKKSQNLSDPKMQCVPTKPGVWLRR